MLNASNYLHNAALLLVALLGAGIGAWVGLGPDPLAGQPDWVRRLPGAAGVGLAVLAAGGLLAFVVAAIAHRGQVAAIHESLAPDGIGTVVLTLVQLFYAPNLVVAAGSFALGAGVSLGGDAFVAPGAVVSGALPAVPVFGAVPVVPGVADFAWLALGPLAGIAAAWWLLRGTGTEVTWLTGLGLGALAPLGAGACWLLLAWASLGDLGTDRLLGLGARFPHLLGWATIPLVVGGALYGVGLALWVGRDSSSPRAQTLQDAPTG
ncbi:MAG: DUF6350 family protein, partial [Propionibacteriaceae bacterium]|nr:DUF6350 family protein [Propionibacteriaceae bacterium]